MTTALVFYAGLVIGVVAGMVVIALLTIQKED